MAHNKKMDAYLADLFAQAQSHAEPLVKKLSQALQRCYELLKEEQAELVSLAGDQRCGEHRADGIAAGVGDAHQALLA